MSYFDANFVANAGVKDIVGRGLIYDDNIAIIELVKNSKDAGSPSVRIEFNLSMDEDTGEEVSEILISDDGKGMTKTEIISKWLNIAYSEKKNTKKAYAGNKGVGRFSCDRLGEKLVLYTKSKSGDYLKLPIEWSDFENKGQSDEISKIKLRGEKLTKKYFLKEVELDDFNRGTILKIQRLRSDWSSKKLKKLISELEKFSPSLDENFEVYLSASEKIDEKNITADLENGRINNNILSKLAFKTTYIKSSIDQKGKYIDTDLYYQGEKIYSYRAINPFALLKGISTEIHYLDTISKAYFTKNIGVHSVSYGSIFLFYNGFRISPYGNPKNDWLGLDQRKSQGTSRNLGTREIFGRIDVSDGDDTFSVITSREGLANNGAFQQLIAYDELDKVELINGKKEFGYISLLIRQLENFVVSGLNWNRLIDKLGKKNVVTLDDVNKDPLRFKAKEISSEQVTDVLNKLLKSSFEVDEVYINSELISSIQKINIDKYEAYKKEFIDKYGDKALSDLNASEKGAVRKIINAEEKAKLAAYDERDYAEKETDVARNELRNEKSKNYYLLSTRRTLSKDADGLIHTIKLNNIDVKNSVENLIDDLSYGDVSRGEILHKLGNIKLNAEKSLKVAELVTRSKFDDDIDGKNVDIPKYIEEYVLLYKDSFSEDLVVNVKSYDGSFIRKISLLSLSIVLDNIISNSNKWGANNMEISFVSDNKDRLEIFVSDDGYGVDEKFIDNPDAMFDLGVRGDYKGDIYEDGSGIGLYYVSSLLKEMDAEVIFVGNNKILKGACFKLVFI